MRTPTAKEAEQIARCAVAQHAAGRIPAPTVEAALANAGEGRTDLCPECGAEYESCRCDVAHPCLDRCGRRTNPYESSAPGYRVVCAANAWPVED